MNATSLVLNSAGDLIQHRLELTVITPVDQVDLYIWMSGYFLSTAQSGETSFDNHDMFHFVLTRQRQVRLNEFLRREKNRV
jgi:hypothetical protein